jgi:hypothetical protein
VHITYTYKRTNELANVMEKIGDTRATLTGHPRRSETQACRYGRIHSQRRQPLFRTYYLSDVVVVVVLKIFVTLTKIKRGGGREEAKIQKIHRFMFVFSYVFGKYS